MEKLAVLVPELLELNGAHRPDEGETTRDVPMYVVHQRVGRVRVQA